jgi:hypothetical protein
LAATNLEALAQDEGGGNESTTDPPNGKCLVESSCTYKRTVTLYPPSYSTEKGVKKTCEKHDGNKINCPGGNNSNCYSTEEKACGPVK